VCDLENLKNEEAMTLDGSQRHSKKNDIYVCKYIYINKYIYMYISVACVLWDLIEEFHSRKRSMEKIF
jgi:hypothetical protein